MERDKLGKIAACTVFAIFVSTFLNTAAGSTTDPCTKTIPVVTVESGDSCPTADGEIISMIIENTTLLLQDYISCKLPTGTSSDDPAASCNKIAEKNPDSPSGNYWITDSTGSPVEVFCEFGSVFPASLNVSGGWMRAAQLNMTDPDQQCPDIWQLHTTPVRLCGKTTGESCDSVTYTTHGVHYQRVCGRVRGYQYSTPAAFSVINGICSGVDCHNNINLPYVEGVSITHGSPREHVWTYAAASSEISGNPHSCPCAGGQAPPSFVGSDYYCEGADDPLWDGQDCGGDEATCCDPPNLPWFCKEIPHESTNTDLEVRLCVDQVLTDEDVRIEFLELYIQ